MEVGSVSLSLPSFFFSSREARAALSPRRASKKMVADAQSPLTPGRKEKVFLVNKNLVKIDGVLRKPSVSPSPKKRARPDDL